MARKIQIEAGSAMLQAELNDSDAADAVWKKLPIEGKVTTWGEEIYFDIPVEMTPGETTTDVNVGTLAYWAPGTAFCIFFGRTPASMSDKPVPASPVAICGKVIGDTEPLKAIADGEKITLSQAEE